MVETPNIMIKSAPKSFSPPCPTGPLLSGPAFHYSHLCGQGGHQASGGLEGGQEGGGWLVGWLVYVLARPIFYLRDSFWCETVHGQTWNSSNQELNLAKHCLNS